MILIFLKVILFLERQTVLQNIKYLGKTSSSFDYINLSVHLSSIVKFLQNEFLKKKKKLDFSILFFEKNIKSTNLTSCQVHQHANYFPRRKCQNYF